MPTVQPPDLRILKTTAAIIENVISAELMTRIRTGLDLTARANTSVAITSKAYTRKGLCLAGRSPIGRWITQLHHAKLIDQLLPKIFCLAAPSILVHPAETPYPSTMTMALPVFLFASASALWRRTWAFDDFDEINGATEVIPGRHRWAEDRKPKEAEAIKVFMPAGSVVVFNGALIHRGEANNSNKDRLAITPQYCNPGLRQIETRVLSLPPSIAGNYSERIKNTLGCNIIEPSFMGYVDGVHPRKLINSAYEGRKYRPELPPSQRISLPIKVMQLLPDRQSSGGEELALVPFACPSLAASRGQEPLNLGDGYEFEKHHPVRSGTELTDGAHQRVGVAP